MTDKKPQSDFEKVCELTEKLGIDGEYSKKDVKEIVELANNVGGIGVVVSEQLNGENMIMVEDYKDGYKKKTFMVQGNSGTDA